MTKTEIVAKIALKSDCYSNHFEYAKYEYQPAK